MPQSETAPFTLNALALLDAERALHEYPSQAMAILPRETLARVIDMGERWLRQPTRPTLNVKVSANPRLATALSDARRAVDALRAIGWDGHSDPKVFLQAKMLTLASPPMSTNGHGASRPATPSAAPVKPLLANAVDVAVEKAQRYDELLQAIPEVQPWTIAHAPDMAHKSALQFVRDAASAHAGKV